MTIPQSIIVTYKLSQDDLKLYDFLRSQYDKQCKPFLGHPERWGRHLKIPLDTVQESLALLEGIGLIWSKKSQKGTWYGLTNLAEAMALFIADSMMETVYDFVVACRVQAFKERDAFRP